MGVGLVGHGGQRAGGFVVPTYFFGLPSILNFFLKKLALNGYEDQYIYLVLTCGSTTAGAGDQMRLADKKFFLFCFSFLLYTKEKRRPAQGSTRGL